MARTLDVMARMRRLVVEEARQRLAFCLQAETAAAAVAHAAADRIAHEQAVASHIAADDQVVEAYISWLPRGTAALEQAREVLERSRAAAEQARAQLNAARSGAEAVDRRIQAAQAVERVAALAREQAELDEAALGRHTGAG